MGVCTVVGSSKIVTCFLLRTDDVLDAPLGGAAIVSCVEGGTGRAGCVSVAEGVLGCSDVFELSWSCTNTLSLLESPTLCKNK